MLRHTLQDISNDIPVSKRFPSDECADIGKSRLSVGELIPENRDSPVVNLSGSLDFQ